jgi:tol-pal system protein YbgF
MSTDSRRFCFSHTIGFPLGVALVLSLMAFGCGSSQESTDQWETTPTVSPTAKLEYRVDSLKNENRRIQGQLDVIAAENRTLTAKNADLETKLSEALAAQKAPPAAPAINTSDMNSAYEAALDLYKKRDFSDAADQFQGLLKAGIGDDLASNCHYWIGESYYGLRKYPDAIQHFEMVFDYKKSTKKAAAQLMIGNSYLASGDKAAAKEAYEKVVSTYPVSSYVKKAQDKLAKIK